MVQLPLALVGLVYVTVLAWANTSNCAIIKATSSWCGQVIRVSFKFRFLAGSEFTW